MNAQRPPRDAPAGKARYDLGWNWRSRLGERKGQPCRVLARGRFNTVLVEFTDGFRVATSRHAVRRPPAYGSLQGSWKAGSTSESERVEICPAAAYPTGR